jgi:hypothetical protein
MARCDLLCCICKSTVIGYKDDVRSTEPMVDVSGACTTCGPLWNKFRIDINSRKDADAALTQDLLTLRGAVAADLHLKIAETNPDEAAKLSAMADIVEAIKG